MQQQPAAEVQWHSLPISDVFSRLETGTRGLSEHQASKRLAMHGPNEFVEQKRPGALSLLLSQFNNLPILLLLAAAAVSVAIGHATDAVAISTAVLLSVFFGFMQEQKAEKALEALKRLTTPRARVVRDGNALSIKSSEIVPGDLILLEEGDKVPADCRVIEAINLAADESSLTGESLPIGKIPLPLPERTSVYERRNLLFSGTIVARGKGRAIAFATGMGTEFGKIAASLQEADKEQTPLQQGLGHMSKQIGAAGIALAALFFIFGYLRSIEPAKMFIAAVTLAVAAIPEGLPTVVTITLALGMQRMAKRNAIVRKLLAVETLGSATVICSDKTGTLTKNEMTVRSIFTNNSYYAVTGRGYQSEGAVLSPAGSPAKISSDANLRLALHCAALSNNASVALDEASGNYAVVGDPTEAALLVAVEKGGIDTEELRDEFARLAEVPFDTNRKMMSTVVSYSGKQLSFVKGAPELVLSRCERILLNGKEQPLTKKLSEHVLAENAAMASKALRVLALAYRETRAKSFTQENTEEGLTLIGLVGMNDPPREDVKAAIALCRAAGIDVVMITGDNGQTALAVAQELGLAGKGAKVLTGNDLDAMGEEELVHALAKVKVYARTLPQHKYTIVSALKKRGEVVAVTGDGVNDAPALKKADIGISMGITGTDVSKEVSDVVLTDDNFSTIVSAIEYGRNIYENIRSFVRFQLSTNVAAMVTMFAAPIFNIPNLPLTPIQILWINIIMDGPPALALGVEPASPDLMMQPPRKKTEGILPANILLSIGLAGLLMAAGTLFVFVYALTSAGAEKAGAMAFTTFVLFQLFNAFNCKSFKRSTFGSILSNKYLFLALAASFLMQLTILYYPPLQPIFSTTIVSSAGLSLDDWLLMLGTAGSILIVDELRKFLLRLSNGNGVSK